MQNNPQNLSEALARIAELEKRNAEIETELNETREHIIRVGERVVPFFLLLGVKDMFKPGDTPGFKRIIWKVTQSVLKNYAQLEALIMRNEGFFESIFNLFLVKYGPEIQKRRTGTIEQWQSPRQQRALGTGQQPGAKAIKGS